MGPNRRHTGSRGPIRKASWRHLIAVLTLVAMAGSGCASTPSADDAREPPLTKAAATAIAEPATVRDAIADGAKIIDVRTPEEFAAGHLRDAVNVDLSSPDFEERLAALDESASYVVYCASGNRAGTAIKSMREQGFDELINGGGCEDLAAFGLP